MKIIVFIITVILLSILAGIILLLVTPLFLDPMLYPMVAKYVFIMQFVYILFSYSILLIWKALSAKFRNLDILSHSFYCLGFTVILFFFLNLFAFGTNAISFLLFMLSSGYASYLIPKVHRTVSNYLIK